MEPLPQTLELASSVDTSSAFRSVKEAIAVFGERILVGSPLPSLPATTPATATKSVRRENSWRFTSSPVATTTIKGEDHKEDIISYNYDYHHHQNKKDDGNNNNGLLDTLRKLEAELEETKMELKLLKERESDTEVALATLNAELHKNMSKLAQAEAAAAGKAAAAAKTVRFDERLNDYMEINDNSYGEIKVEEDIVKKKKKKKETLAQILSVGERSEIYNCLGNNGKMMRERKVKKKMKPIIPLVGDFFSKKKGSPSSHHNPLYASPSFYD